MLVTRNPVCQRAVKNVVQANQGGGQRALRRKGLLALTLAVSACGLLAGAQQLRADNVWNSTTSGDSWSTNTKWTPTAPTGGPSAIGDIDWINTNITGSTTVNIFQTGNSGTTVKTLGVLYIGDTDNTNVFTLAAGTGGGSLSFNNNGAGAQINVVATSKGDTISAPIAIVDAAGLTVNNSANTLTISGVISGTSSLMLSGTKALMLSGANTFTGGMTIINGTALANISTTATAGAFGPSSSIITLGSTAGAAGGSATLMANAFTVSNPVNLATGAVGSLSIGNSGATGTATFSGAVNLNGNNLQLFSKGSTTSYITTFSGGFSGAGNITINNGGVSTDAAVTNITTGTIDNTGAITNSGIGSGTTTISSTIGSHVTGVSQNSSTSPLTVSSALTVAQANTFSNTATGTALFTVSGAITGTGDLTVTNNNSTDNSMKFTNVNNAGAIIVGSSKGAISITGANAVGANVTSISDATGATALLNLGTVTTATTSQFIDISANLTGSALSFTLGNKARNVINATLTGNNINLGNWVTGGNKGSIAFNTSAAIGANGNTITNTGVDLVYTGTGETLNHNIVGSSGTNGIINNGTGAINWSGNYNVTGNFYLGGTSSVFNTFSGKISSVTGNQIANDGAGLQINRTTFGEWASNSNWYLSNTNNSYTGATTVNSGTLKIAGDGVNPGDPGSLGAVPAATLTANSQSQLALGATATLMADRPGLVLAASRGLMFSIATNNTVNDTIDAGGGDFTINGLVTNNGNQGVINKLTLQNTGTGNIYFSGTAAPSTKSAGTGTVALQLLGNSSGSNRNLTFTSGPGGSNITINGIGRSILFTGNANDNDTVTLDSGYTGTATLTGTSTYTGATTVSGGTLSLQNGGSLAATAISIGGGASLKVGNFTATGSVTLTGGSTPATQSVFSMADGAITTFNLTPAALSTVLNIGGTSSGMLSILNFDIGPSGTADNINLGTNGKINVKTGGGIINITGLTGWGPGTYNLFTFGSGNATNLTGLTLGTTPSSTTPYSFALGSDGTHEYLTVMVLSTAYWTGANGTAWNASVPSNFSADAAGTSPTTLTATSDVIFSKTGGVGSVSTTLGADTTIKTLTFAADQTASVTIASGNTLTINADSNTGITVASGSGAHTIAANVALGASQSWINNSTNPLTVSGNVSGTSGTTLSTGGSGTIVLSGTNTSFAGPVNITGGTLSISNSNNLGDASTTNALTINGGTLEVTGNSAVDLGANRTVTMGVFGGTFQVDGTGSLTVSGATSGSGTLTKTGSGTIILNGSSSGTGATSVKGGTLRLGAATNGGLASGALTVLGNGAVIESSSGTVAINSNVVINDSTATTPTAITVKLNNVTINGVLRSYADGYDNGTLRNYAIDPPIPYNADSNTIYVNSSSTLTINGPVATNAMGNAKLRGLTFDGDGTIAFNGNFGRIADNPGNASQRGATLNQVYALSTATGNAGADFIQTSTNFAGVLKLNSSSVGAVQFIVNGGTLLVNAPDTVAVKTGISGTFNANSNVITGVSADDIAKVTINDSLEGVTVNAAGGYPLQEAAVVATTPATSGNNGTITLNANIITSGSASNISTGLPSVFGDSQLTANIPVRLGATTGNFSASILIGGNYTVQHMINLQSGTNGTLTLGATAQATTAGFAGNITLGSGSTGQNVTFSAPTGVELDVSGNVLANGTSGNVTIVGGGLIKLTGVNTYTGTTTVKAGELDVAMMPSGNALTVETGAKFKLLAKAGDNQLTTLSTFTVAGGANTLDFANNAVLVSGTGASGQEYKVSTSITRLADPSGSATVQTTGVLSGAEWNNLNSVNTYADDALVLKYVMAGDANMDGKITMDDYLQIDSGYLFGGNTWALGDFNHDGVVDVSDYKLIDHNFLHQGGPGAQDIVELHAQWFGADYMAEVTAVPEPASLLLLGVGAIGLLSRRRK